MKQLAYGNKYLNNKIGVDINCLDDFMFIDDISVVILQMMAAEADHLARDRMAVMKATFNNGDKPCT